MDKTLSLHAAERPGGANRKRRRKPAWGKIIAFIAVFAAMAAAWRWTPLSEYVTQQRVTGWARAVRELEWAPLLVILAYTPAAFLMFPRPLLTLFTVIAFGPWLGFTYGMTGIIASALATYYTGRALSPETLKRVAGDRADEVTGVLRKHGLLSILAIRIVPVAPFAVEGILAGAARIKLWQYTVGTFGGMLPGVLATTIFGHQIATALDDPSSINYGIVAAVVVFFVALTWFVKRWFESHQDD